MNIQSIDINLLKTNLNNVKKHNKKNIEAIKKSLIEFKQYKPLIVNKDYQLLVGKGTFLAMKQLKYEKVDILVKDLTKDQENQLIVLDNRTSQLSEFDTEMIQKLFYELNSQQVLLTGYNNEQVDKIMNDSQNTQDETQKINLAYFTCPYCKTKFSIDQ